MTDKKMIETLRDYARTYTSGSPYSFNPGLALMIANRMEHLVAIVENGNYHSKLSKETLQYNIQYHLLNDCKTVEECVKRIKHILESFEDKENDRKDQ